MMLLSLAVVVVGAADEGDVFLVDLRIGKMGVFQDGTVGARLKKETAALIEAFDGGIGMYLQA